MLGLLQYSTQMKAIKQADAALTGWIRAAYGGRQVSGGGGVFVGDYRQEVCSAKRPKKSPHRSGISTSSFIPENKTHKEKEKKKGCCIFYYHHLQLQMKLGLQRRHSRILSILSLKSSLKPPLSAK